MELKGLENKTAVDREEVKEIKSEQKFKFSLCSVLYENGKITIELSHSGSCRVKLFVTQMNAGRIV